MIISVLFIISALARVPTWAKVVVNFDECRVFFYENTEPQGMDQNGMKICQKYGNTYFYASLYSKFHKIPVYSAYIFNPSCSSQGGRKSGNWFIEPQLSGYNEDTMQADTSVIRDIIKLSQAVNGDYSNTGYDRGHLNPNSFQCDHGRTATFTLTNSAPMDACFNRVHWYQWEKAVHGILSAETKEGTVYLVTGTVPSQGYKIPRQGEFDDLEARDFNRVTVPTHIWTAVCFKHSKNQDLSFSFGYIGLNKPDSGINVNTIPQLNDELARLYGAPVKIFTDDCFSSNMQSQRMAKSVYQKVTISNKLEMNSDIQNIVHAGISQFDDKAGPPIKNPKVTDVKIFETYNSMESWMKEIERMKYVSGSVCVLSQKFTGPLKSLSSTGIQKIDKADNSQELVCSIVPEKVPPCSTSCLYNEDMRGYYCYEGTTKRSCSPLYSIITVKGTTCNNDHTCGTYGYKYYWCRVGKSWDYCSPPLPIGKGHEGKLCRSNHNCGWYGSRYTWCYTDYSNNWDKCCMKGDDRFSALNGRTCKPDHPCGHYGYKYLWCKTTDGTWDYCCTP